MVPLQVPEPSHVPGVVCVPAEHPRTAHVVPAGHCSHAPLSQLPSVPQVVFAVEAQSILGSGPSAASAHVPSAPEVSAAEHARQASVHAESQQTPSTQKPLWHPAASVHGEPLPPPEPLDVELVEVEVELVEVEPELLAEPELLVELVELVVGVPPVPA